MKSILNLILITVSCFESTRIFREICCLSSLGRSTTGDTLRGRCRLSRLFARSSSSLGRRLALSRSRQLGSQLSLELADNLRIWNGLSGLVFGHDLWLFVDCRGEFLLRHLFGRTGLHNGFAETLVNLGNGSDIGGFFQLGKIEENNASGPSTQRKASTKLQYLLSSLPSWPT